MYPNDAVWGGLQGRRFGDDKATYFRTAIHELGHALGLYHNMADNGFMNTTDSIARRAHPQRPFPENIRWAFNPDDEKRLRHMPDVWVRPGGIQFGEDYSVAPVAADDTIAVPEALALEVRPIQSIIPFGAPARVDFEVKNVSNAPAIAPQNLSMRGGNVRGTVIDPAGTVRTFQPLVQCIESQPLVRLAPDETVSFSATLLRGPQGALFPAPGLYRIVVEVRWEDVGGRYGLLGATDLMVLVPNNLNEAKAAFDVIANPDALVAIAASAPAGKGAEAIHRASADPTLGPHYVWLDVKSACVRPDSEANRQALQALDTSAPVLSTAERKKAAAWLDDLIAAKPKTKAKSAKRVAADDDLSALAARVRDRLG
jgi:hypothetical protein